MANQLQNDPTTVVNKWRTRQLSLLGKILMRMMAFPFFYTLGFMFLYALPYFFPNFSNCWINDKVEIIEILRHYCFWFFICWSCSMALMGRLMPQLIFKKVERIERLNVLGKILFSLFILPCFLIQYLWLYVFIVLRFFCDNNFLINNKENLILFGNCLFLFYIVVCVPIGLIERFKPQLFFKNQEMENQMTNHPHHEPMVMIRHVSGKLSSFGKILFGIFSLPVVIMILFVVLCGFSYFLVPNFWLNNKEKCEIVYYYVMMMLLVCSCPVGVIKRFKPQLFFKKGEYIEN